MIMHKRSYTHVQVLLPEIRAMVSEGKIQREIAEHFGLSGKEVVRELLKRERRKEAKISAGIMPRPKGRPRKDATPRSILLLNRSYEISRLKMENKLLRDFLQLAGRK
jgi:transposase